MNQEIKTQWVAALRSGAYNQTTGLLKDDYGYCCLGVLEDLHCKADPQHVFPTDVDDLNNASEAILCKSTKDWACLPDRDPTVVRLGDVSFLANLNDCGLDFPSIADLIEAQL